MKDIKPFIKVMPFLILGVCFALSFLVYMPWYETAYMYLSNVIGFSLFTNCFFLYFIVRNNMCAYSLVATIGLVCLNLLNIAHIYFDIPNFYRYYLTGVSGFFFILTLIFFLTSIQNGKRGAAS